MRLFVDTSALIKRYIEETGSQQIDRLFEEASQIIVSPITKIETESTFRRLLEEKSIDNIIYQNLRNELEDDFKFFNIIYWHKNIEESAIEMVKKYQLKTLDSIQAGTVLWQKNLIDKIVLSDKKLKNSLIKEGFYIIDPTEM